MIYFDLETTGLLLPPQADPKRQPRIVQAAWAVDDGPVSVELCNPGAPIPAEASRIHGITDEMVAYKQSEESLFCKLSKLLHDERDVCAYNASFDLSVISYASLRHGYFMGIGFNVTDPMLMAEDRFGTRFKLVDLHERLLGHKPAKAHDAAADVESLRRVHLTLAGA